MSAAGVNKLIWMLIYGGLFALALGIALHRNGEPFGAPVIVVGALVTLAGAVLVWVRSRMSDEPAP